MNFPLVPEYKTDLLHVNPDNQKRGEPFTLERSTYSRILVPRHAPAFAKSVRLYNANLQELIPGKDWRIFKIMPALTELTATSVTCMIEVMNTEVLSGFIDYDIVGEFSLFDESLMQMIAEMVGQDIDKVSWDQIRNKPEWFKPKLHGHSLIYDIMYFKDFVDLVDGVLTIAKTQGRTVVEAKISHYFNTFTNYLNAYKTEIKAKLDAHKAAYNAHGLNKGHIGLPLVDNFGTVRGQDALVKRSDKHLTPTGLKAIIRTQAADLDKLLPVNQLPISQFGNSNFIPPSIAGSFEGLGGISESSAICMETDGTIVMLENRMDGRVQGLYFSTITNPYVNPKRTYSAYQYEHQKFKAENSNPDRVVQGSGSEIIMVMDSLNGKFFLGLTNGTLDPGKHVYSLVDMSAVKAVFPDGSDNLLSWVGQMSIVSMGDWIYLFAASPYVNRTAPYPAGNNFRHCFRAPKATVQLTNPVAFTPVNLTYRDGDNVQVTNQPYWRWGTPVPVPGGTPDEYSKWYFTFVQTTGVRSTGSYRSQPSYACEIPTKPGKYQLRFASAWWANYTIPNLSQTFNCMIEMVYEIDPATNVMTLVRQTPKTAPVDFTAGDHELSNTMYGLVFLDKEQGSAILEDGTLICSTAAYQSFPRGFIMYRAKAAKSRWAMMNRGWNLGLGELEQYVDQMEEIVSPLKSSVKPRSFLLGNKGDFFCAADPTTLAFNRLYYRSSPGKLAPQANVTNLYLGNIYARPLSNDVREVRGPSTMGGATVTGPSASLAGITDAGLATFCFATETRWQNGGTLPGQWPTTASLDDIKLMVDHTIRNEANLECTVVPNGTILYPKAIVDRFKNEVADPAGLAICPTVIVQVCDPTGGPLTTKFGWLPVFVVISWAKVGTTQRRTTLMSIAPTYSGGTDKTVTNYTVLDKIHYGEGIDNVAADLTPTKWDVALGGNQPNGTHGAMRVGYYVDGNTVHGYVDAGIQAAGIGDALVVKFLFKYTDRASKRWSATPGDVVGYIIGQSGGGNHQAVVPDGGVVQAYPHITTTGGAATIFESYNGSGINYLLGSVYPQSGWFLYFQTEIQAVFNGIPYTFPVGSVDLRTIDPSPGNKTFYIYAMVEDGKATYVIAQDQRLESPFQVWVAKVTTNATQIIEIERFNVFAINGNRVSEIKRGGAIPATSGLASKEGQLPWIRDNELIP
ncbi:hypothetical protein D3C79_49850 [compost metagenome]